MASSGFTSANRGPVFTLPGSRQEPSRSPLQLPIVQLTKLHTHRDAVRVGEDERGAASDAVDLAHRPVAVIGHRKAPAVLQHLLPGVLPGVHHVHPDELDTRHPPPYTLDRVELRPAGPASALEPEDDHKRPVEVVADPQYVIP